MNTSEQAPKQKIKAKLKLRPKPTPSEPLASIQLIKHFPSFISTDRASDLLHAMQALIPWYRFAASPNSRLVYHWNSPIGDPGLDTMLVGLVMDLQQTYNIDVEGVFCNLYRNGNDYCPYHRDTYGCDVWTLSLGDTRDFLVKKDGVGTRADTWTLKSGDLYYMSEKLHKTHRHSIPVRKGRQGSRISVVFFATNRK